MKATATPGNQYPRLWVPGLHQKWYWPTIDNIDTAREAALTGSYVAFLVAGLTGAFALLSAFRILNWIDPWALIDAVVFTALGFLIRRMSRVAATAALILFLFERVYEASARGWKASVGLLAAILVIRFASGIRGTFAYHRYKRQEATPYQNIL
jgi:hypothetical protein